jgi:hypothetical protein
MKKVYRLDVIIEADGEIFPDELTYRVGYDGQLVIYSKDPGVDIISSTITHKGEITEIK